MENIEYKNKIEEVLKRISEHMGISYVTEINESPEDGSLKVALHVEENARLLIGKNGDNLRALEHVLKLACSRGETQPKSISLDVNDYKKARAIQVLEIAKQTVSRVRNTQKAEAMVPMSPYERKIVHTELASSPDIITESIGEGPHRRIVIKPYP